MRGLVRAVSSVGVFFGSLFRSPYDVLWEDFLDDAEENKDITSALVHDGTPDSIRQRIVQILFLPGSINTPHFLDFDVVLNADTPAYVLEYVSEEFTRLEQRLGHTIDNEFTRRFKRLLERRSGRCV